MIISNPKAESFCDYADVVPVEFPPYVRERIIKNIRPYQQVLE